MPANILVPQSFIFEPTAFSPAIVIQVTELVKSYMIWVGTTDSADSLNNASTIERIVSSQGNLAKDWACAMPPLGTSSESVGTPLFRSNAEDVALGMAQRLARRFKKQILLSVDTPASFANPGQANHVVLYMEKLIGKTLIGLEGAPASA